MRRRIKIIHLLDAALYGGAESGIIKRAKRLDKKKYDIQFCFLFKDNPSKCIFEAAGFPVFVIGMHHNKEIRGLVRLLLFLRRNKPHVLHTHFANSDLYGIIIGKLLQIPIIISTYHMMRDWHRTRKRRDRIRLYLNKILSKYFDRIAAVSEGVRLSALKVEKLSKKKILTVYNGIDLKQFRKLQSENLRTELGISESTKIIGNVGRLCIEKGQKYLVQSMQIIIKEYPNVKLIIIGDGELYPELKNLISTLNLIDKVMLVGHQDNIPEFLSILDVFILPSLTEGMPNSLLEAMACELPCIATNLPGVMEILDQNIDGIIIEKADILQIAEKTLYLLKNPEKAKLMGKKARKKIMKNYNISYTYKNLQIIYDDLVQKKIMKN